MKSWVLCLVALLTLSACGGLRSSAINPLNWFGSSNSEEVLPASATVVQDSRPLVQDITNVSLERVPGGAILHARGIVPVPGWFDAGLVRDRSQSGSGIVTFGFRAEPPVEPSSGGGNARIITAARFLSDGDLEGVREIRVVSRARARTTRP